MNTFLYVTFITLFAFVYATEECKDNIELHLGANSPYRNVANRNYDKNDEYDGCLKKIWMIVRHGTRNPSAKLIARMHSHLPLFRDIILERNSNGSTYLVKSDLELFEKWKPRVEEKDETKLTVEGEREMLELAERMQARFPDILSPIYSNTSYQFRYTKTQRTRKSARYFATGLFGRKTAKDVYFPEPLDQDPILRFYKLCTKWKNTVKKNPESLSERKKFEESPVAKAALAKVGKRLGVGDILTFDEAMLMYDTCAFETAWTSKKKSPWCLGFDLDTVKVMEFAEDLKYYWIDGYGYNLTYKQACPALGNMINFLEDKNLYPKAVSYFTHSGTLLKIMGHLGLYKDERVLKHSDFHTSHDRKWCVSKIDTFGTNIAFILHECENKSKILVLHNENVVRVPCCLDSDLCDLEVFKKYYRESFDSCSFDEICENRSSKAI